MWLKRTCMTLGELLEWQGTAHDSVGIINLYDLQRYKALRCCAPDHFLFYPKGLREPRTSHDIGEQKEMNDSDAVRLQLCPFFHTLPERDSWNWVRQAFYGVEVGLATPNDIERRVLPLFRSSEWFKKLELVVESYRRKIALMLSENPKCYVEALGLLEIAHLMEAPSTHHTLCFLTHAELGGISLKVVEGCPRTSPAIEIDTCWILREIAIESQASIVRILNLDDDCGKSSFPAERLRAVGCWLLRVDEESKQRQHKKGGFDLPFYPYHVEDPFRNDSPHFHIAFITSLREWLSGGLSNRRSGDALAEQHPSPVAPLEWLITMDYALQMWLANWIVVRARWFSKSGVNKEAILRYLSDGYAA